MPAWKCLEVELELDVTRIPACLSNSDLKCSKDILGDYSSAYFGYLESGKSQAKSEDVELGTFHDQLLRTFGQSSI